MNNDNMNDNQNEVIENGQNEAVEAVQTTAVVKNPKNTNKKPRINKNTLKYGSTALITLAIFVAIAIVLNIIASMLDLKIDLTANKLYSMDDKSKEIISKVTKDVTIYGLYDDKQVSSTDSQNNFVQLLKQYAGTNSKIHVQYVDPDKNPGFIKKYSNSENTSIAKNDYIVECGKKFKIISSTDMYTTEVDQNTFETNITGSNAEQEFTGAIKFVTADKTPTIYFVSGFGEASLDSDLTNMKKILQNNNYVVKPLNLISVTKIPSDATMIIDVAPQRDISIAQRGIILDYLHSGGKAYFMFDSLGSDPAMENYDFILKDNALSLGHDRVVETDTGRQYAKNNAYFVSEVPGGKVVPQSLQVLLNSSRSINQLKNDKEYITQIPIVTTSETALSNPLTSKNNRNLKGTHNIAIAVENQSAKSKIIAMGNGNFITDNVIQNNPLYQQSIYYFFSSLSWMDGQKNETIIQPKSFAAQTLNITNDESYVFAAISIVVMPLLILGFGIFIWARRRHL